MYEIKTEYVNEDKEMSDLSIYLTKSKYYDNQSYQ